MHRLNLPTNATFVQHLGAVEDYARPMRDMWSSFWLKAAAAYSGELWYLCYFALVGRWSEATTAEPVWEPLDSLVALSKRLDAAEAWALLNRLVTDGTIELSPSVIARAPDVQVPSTDLWQVLTPSSIGNTIADVVEEAQWRWLHDYGWGQWLTDSPAKDSLQRRTSRELEQVGLKNYQSFISTYFGSGEQRQNDADADMFQFQLDLPLALRVSPGIPDPSLPLLCSRRSLWTTW
jgi:hypothetical protein